MWDFADTEDINPDQRKLPQSDKVPRYRTRLIQDPRGLQTEDPHFYLTPIRYMVQICDISLHMDDFSVIREQK